MEVLKFIGNSIVIVLVAALCISNIIAKPLADTNQITNNAPRCGEVLTKTTSGIIYKPFENVAENERCIWIIGVQGAKGYDIEIVDLGNNTNQPDGGQGLVLTGVRHSRVSTDPPTFSTYLSTTDEKIRLVNLHILIVTFYSGNGTSQETSTGFILKYTGILTGNITAINNQSSHYISEPSTYKLQYPPSGQNYGIGELAAFAFPPKGNIYEGTGNHAVFDVDGTEDRCYDPLWTFEFNLDGRYQWNFRGRICKDISSSHLFPFKDLALVLFNTDYSVVGSGFTYSIFDFK